MLLLPYSTVGFWPPFLATMSHRCVVVKISFTVIRICCSIVSGDIRVPGRVPSNVSLDLTSFTLPERSSSWSCALTRSLFSRTNFGANRGSWSGCSSHEAPWKFSALMLSEGISSLVLGPLPAVPYMRC
ncbi:hypothetical protein L1987_08836 [Smallanthus sonchifolius]|uniref:Uncharacterized protein n=1 Tax=Smallanthus sonchifolius TaxID=185202 RepID=A0ACB9JLQ4_9ASTR|nr:hypothetical protein L1987_08836 [Smallanthus sonchifolius]